MQMVAEMGSVLLRKLQALRTNLEGPPLTTVSGKSMPLLNLAYLLGGAVFSSTGTGKWCGSRGHAFGGSSLATHVEFTESFQEWACRRGRG